MKDPDASDPAKYKRRPGPFGPAWALLPKDQQPLLLDGATAASEALERLVDDASLSVRDLRRRWKPHKERLQDCHNGQATAVRFHRACSWLAKVEAADGAEEHDLDLISLWIAFNALYGQWDSAKREPRPDRECWQTFAKRILDLDQNGCVAASLQEHKRLVMSLLEDAYLSGFFWQEPSAKRAGQSKKAKYNAQTWYIEERWVMVFEQLLDRIYVMRCQLVHGAATDGGRLNRTSLRRCVMMMQRLLHAVLLVWVDHGADQDWGPMCYPPLRNV